MVEEVNLMMVTIVIWLWIITNDPWVINSYDPNNRLLLLFTMFKPSPSTSTTRCLWCKGDCKQLKLSVFSLNITLVLSLNNLQILILVQCQWLLVTPKMENAAQKTNTTNTIQKLIARSASRSGNTDGGTLFNQMGQLWKISPDGKRKITPEQGDEGQVSYFCDRLRTFNWNISGSTCCNNETNAERIKVIWKYALVNTYSFFYI